MKRLHIRIDEDLDDALGRLAAEEGVSKAALVRRPPWSAASFASSSIRCRRCRPIPSRGSAAAPASRRNRSTTSSTGDPRAGSPRQTSATGTTPTRSRCWPTTGTPGLVTSNHVRGETWTYLRRRAGHRHAVAFLDATERSPRVRVVTVPDELESQALRWLRRHDEREHSFVDATSFMLAKALRVREVLAFDGDFSAAGFVELRPHRAG
jgi:uncharacterized protein